jgi:hypothetical protein
MWYTKLSPKALGLLASLALLAGAAHADIRTVGPAPNNTYPTIEAALAAAGAGDVLILDDAGSPYVLTNEVVIDASLKPLRIQGQTNNGERPDEIVIEGAAGQPVFTVESDAEVIFRHLTITGGTVGIQAMADSTVTLERIYVSETGNEGMSVTDAEQVDIVSSIFNACGAEGLIVNSGTVDIAQCTFIDNTDLAIDLQGGDCQVGASLFYNNNGARTADQLDAAVAGLEIDFCLVDGATPAIVNVVNPPVIQPAVTTAFADPENLVFDSASTWRGKVLLEITCGSAAASIATDATFGRDFLFLSRDLTDTQIGAHEFGAVATTAVWVDCLIRQNGVPLRAVTGGSDEYAAAGTIVIEVQLSSGSLDGAVLFLEPENGDVTIPEGRVVIPLGTPAIGAENYAITSYFIEPDHFVDAHGTNLLLDGAAILYLQVPQLGGTAGLDFPGVGTDDYGGVGGGIIESAAEAGRRFIIDTVPPQIVGFSVNRADDYLTLTSDGDTPVTETAGITVPFWSASDGAESPIASSTGALDGRVGGPDPHLFFNEKSGDLAFTIRMEFADSAMITDGTTTYTVSENAGFAAAAGADTATGAAIYTLLTHPAARSLSPLGRAWWEMVDSLPVDLTTSLDITYAGGAGSNLVVNWIFQNVPTDLPLGNGFWESIVQVGAMDLAGNTSGANPTSNPLIQTLSPFHFWQLIAVQTALTSGPNGRETTSPVINWGVQRFAGVSPTNTDNAFPIAQYAVYGRPAGEDPNSLGWTAIDATGTPVSNSPPIWSDWISTPRIDAFTIFSSGAGTLLGNLVSGPGQYMIVVRGADEAGNVSDVSTVPNGDSVFLAGFNGTALVADTWTNGGAGIGIDTRIAPTFWHNITSGGNLRYPDGGERTFGAATRIPLPPEGTCQRVEGGFTLTMELTDNIDPANAGVYFELFEDGALAATGYIYNAGTTNLRLSIPQDLLDPAGVSPGVMVPGIFENFLNFATVDCDGGGLDQDRLGDEGDTSAEPPYRQRDVRYRLVAATALDDGTGAPDFDAIDITPATVEFTVTVDRGLKDDQPIKSFVKE